MTFQYNVGITVDPADAAELDRWYATEHVAEMLTIPGITGARRFVSVLEPGSFLVQYEVSDPSVVTGPEYTGRPVSEWTARVRPLWRRVDRGLWRPLDGAVDSR